MSALLGYSLRNFDARFQVEKLMYNAGAWGHGESLNEWDDEDPTEKNPFAKDSRAAERMENYISSFGPEEARRMTSVASVEARMAMEMHISSLFGDLSKLQEEVQSAVGVVSSVQEANLKLMQAVAGHKVKTLRITSDDLTRLVLEAMAYGALLRDAENHVSSTYELTPYLPRGDDDGGVIPVRPKLPQPLSP